MPNPTRTGYSFDGWYTAKEGGSRVVSGAKVTITANQTLYAHWDADVYNITLDANGGSSLIKSKTVSYNSTYGSLPTPSRTGYSFDGWYTELNGGTKVTGSSKLVKSGDHTLYAHWSASNYTVSFNGNGGNASSSSKSVTYNSTYGTLPTASRTGYTFDGWYTAKDGGNKVNEDTKFTSTSNQTLYAHWKANTYTVSFNLNGGSGAADSKTVSYGSNYGTLPTASRTGYGFDGWYTEANGGTKITADTKVAITSNQTLYAHWTVNVYTVTYNANGGNVSTASVKVEHGKSVTLPTPTRTGYTCLGWSTSSSATSAVYKCGDSYSPTSGITLYAVWHKDISAPVVTVSNVPKTGKIKLSWNNVDGAVSYNVYRATKKAGPYSLKYSTKSTNYTNTSATAGVTYYYKVEAVGADGTRSPFSEIVLRACDLPRPEVSTASVASTGKIKISWKAIDGAVSYKVYRSETKDGEYTRIRTTTATSYTDTSAVVGKKYYYKVRAIAEKSAANSAYSSPLYRTCDLARPSVTVSYTKSGKPKLTWNAVDGAVSYKIYRSDSENGTYKLLKTTTSTSFTNISVSKGATYYYKVKAVCSNSAANSAGALVKASV